MTHFHRIRGVLPPLQAAAEVLRHESTEPERHMWSLLGNRMLDGLTFRRQHPIGSYVLDFYCAELKLAIEIDGASHHERADYVADRTLRLEAHGISVIRISNTSALADTDPVIDRIHATVASMRRNGDPAEAPDE